MDTTLKPQITDKNETKMKPQIDKERKMKNKILTIIWVMLFLLAGGLFLGGGNISSDVRGMGFLSLCALCFINNCQPVDEELVGDHPRWHLCQP